MDLLLCYPRVRYYRKCNQLKPPSPEAVLECRKQGVTENKRKRKKSDNDAVIIDDVIGNSQAAVFNKMQISKVAVSIPLMFDQEGKDRETCRMSLHKEKYREIQMPR